MNQTLALSPRDQSMLDGSDGPATQMAMSIVVQMAHIYGASHLMDISAAHIDSTVYIGGAGLEFAEKLAGLGAKVAVPTTLNVSGVDEHGWEEWSTPPDWADQAHRQMVAYASMGTTPTWTCAPYQTEHRPAFGQQVAWGESNAIAFANSVIGARTNRYPDLLDVCCAITGRVPAAGLHLTENRAGNLHLHLQDIPVALQQDESFYPVLGHLLGKLAGDSIPVITGLSVTPTEDQLKALGAGSASSGAVALFHIVGVTPEAPTLAAALQDGQPTRRVDVSLAMLRAARRELTTANGEPLDLVVLGSPHFSLAEFRQLAPLLAGQKCHPNLRFLVTTSRMMNLLAHKAGLLEPLEAFGGKVTVDTCILTSPMLPASVKTLMTNSAKYAYYSPGLLQMQTVFGSLQDCVQSAVTGQVVRDERLWEGEAEEALWENRGQTVSPLSGVPSGQPLRGQLSTVQGSPFIAGSAEGEALVSSEPLSFWGGYDHRNGEIIDRRHPLAGQIAAGKILVVPFTRGSSTTTAVLLEAVRADTAPAAILTTQVDSFFALASIVANELYGKKIPLVVLPPEVCAAIPPGAHLSVAVDGSVHLRKSTVSA
jgi:predicted aconitase/predicted aconitase with swiveling domain